MNIIRGTDWGRLLLIVCSGFLSAVQIVYVLVVLPHSCHHETRPKLTCQNNLRQLGGLVKLQDEASNLEPLPGAAFLTKFAWVMPEEDLDVYLCPCDPDAEGRRGGDYCSYYGPDEELLSRMRTDGRLMGGDMLIVACCPRHEDGVAVLYSSGKVGFVPWEDVQGSDGDPVPIGPDSPDPRFRHLVR